MTSQSSLLLLKPLSKSSYTTGLECPGHLWMKYHDKENIPLHTPGVLKRFEQGILVGQLAQKLFPEGIAIPEKDYTENIKRTKELLQKRKILFEAGLLVDNLYCRADILIPVNKDQWDIIEVKSSTKVDKNEHYPDLAFQRHVYEKAGLKIRKCFLMYLNKEYIKDGEIDIQQLFTKEDLTEEIDEIMVEVPENIEFLLNIINSPTFPNTTEKNHCTAPKTCLVKDRCWDFLPEHHVFHLYNGRKNRALFDEGIHDLRDVPKGSNAQQVIQLECAKTGKTHIDEKQIKRFLETLGDVQCHLDFETCMFAIPEFDGTRPYQKIPFQFSLQVVPGAHFEYLHNGRDDPRPGFLTALKE